MNKKDIIKIILIVILIGVIGFETFYVLKKDKNIDTSDQQTLDALQDEDLTKYIVDLTKPYYKNGITLNMKEKSGYFFQQVNGLKDKKVQEKINKEIEKNIKEIYVNLPEDYNKDYTLVSTSVTINHSNILGIEYFAIDFSEYDYEDKITIETAISHQEGTNEVVKKATYFDLNTGNEIYLKDMVSNIDLFKEKISYIAEEDINKLIGYAYADFPTLKVDNSEYFSTVEDSVLSVMNQFKKGNYILQIEPNCFVLRLKDTYIKSVSRCYEEDKDYKKCKKKIVKSRNGKEKYTIYVRDELLSEIDLTIPFIDIKDYIVLYNHYERGNDLYEKEREKEPRVFIESDEENNENISYISSSNTEHIDYELATYYENNTPFKEIREQAIKDAQKVKSKDYNIYIMNGEMYEITNNTDDKENFPNEKRYYIAYFDIYHYHMSKEKYDSIQQKLYEIKYKRLDYDIGMISFNQTHFNFIKNYYDKKNRYTYIFNKEGKQVKATDMFDKDALAKYIPEDWYGEDTNVTLDDLLNSLYLVTDSKNLNKNKLGISIESGEITFEYKGESNLVSDEYEECNRIIEEILK